MLGSWGLARGEAAAWSWKAGRRAGGCSEVMSWGISLLEPFIAYETQLLCPGAPAHLPIVGCTLLIEQLNREPSVSRVYYLFLDGFALLR